MFGRPANRDRRKILVELVVIVAGINIALWLDGWFEAQSERKIERQNLKGLRGELRDDTGNLDRLIEWNGGKTGILADIIAAQGDVFERFELLQRPDFVLKGGIVYNKDGVPTFQNRGAAGTR